MSDMEDDFDPAFNGDSSSLKDTFFSPAML